LNLSLRERVLEQLAEHHVLTLATAGPEGPWAAAVFYAHDGLTLYFLSSPNSRHSLNIADGAEVAATIQRDYDDWPGIHGLQLCGRAEPVPANDVAIVRERYGKRFPVVGLAARAPAAIVRALDRIRWYALYPRSIWVVDNRLGFGHREQLDL
jgi:uncharacterized protein YhbP (UPF0306 family)